jgi:uncharacterized membrane protein
LSGAAGLALAVTAFVGSHLALSHPLRRPLCERLGDRGFFLLYSAVAAATLAWIILAYQRSDERLWEAPLWSWKPGSAIVALASILLVGSFVGNPAFPHPGAEAQEMPPAKGVFAVTRHPMNWSVMLWAAVHGTLWSSPPVLVLAGGMFVLALVGSLGQDLKKASAPNSRWGEWQARTSFFPFVALFQRRASWRNLAKGWPALIGGLAFWFAITRYHAPLGLGLTPQSIG